MHRIKTVLILFYTSVFLISCTSPGSLIDENVSENHYYNSSESAVMFAPMGGDCYAIGCQEIEGADLDTFKPLNNYYARDKNYVYYEHQKIEGADSDTFKLLNDLYTTDKNYAYYTNKRISGESPGDFKAVGGPFAAGTNAVYWNGTIVPSADPSTFEAIAFEFNENTNYYGKDKNAIFCQTSQLSEQPAQFRPLDNGAYFADGKAVYYLYTCESIAADPTTFEILYTKDDTGVGYGKDSEKVFLLGPGLHKAIEGADPETFIVLLCSGSPDYAKDKNRVYKYGTVVEDANPATFELPEECK